MKEKVNQMFKDKLFLVMLVLGLLTIVAAAGVVTVQRRKNTEQSPYLEMQEPEKIAAETAPEENIQVAGSSDAASDKQQENLAVSGKDAKAEKAPEETAEEMKEAEAGNQAAQALALNFNDASRMAWPHVGNVILDYSMDTTIYFPTLDQYKCNPAIVIQAEVSEPVVCPANARVLEAGNNEEFGNYLLLDLGNEYTAICGQLKEVQAAAGEYLEKGQLLGYVAEPTKYYSVEGSNVYLQLKYQDKTMDPLDYME